MFKTLDYCGSIVRNMVKLEIFAQEFCRPKVVYARLHIYSNIVFTVHCHYPHTQQSLEISSSCNELSTQT